MYISKLDTAILTSQTDKNSIREPTEKQRNLPEPRIGRERIKVSRIRCQELRRKYLSTSYCQWPNLRKLEGLMSSVSPIKRTQG